MPEQKPKSQCNLCDMPSVRELFDKELAHLKEQTALHFRVLEIATQKAEDILNERLGRMNEFREAMKDQAAQYVTRTEMDLQLQALVDDVRGLRQFASEHKGAASVASVYLAGLVSAVAVVISLLSIFR